MDLLSVNAEKFWVRVDKSGECWIWLGAKRPTGYGVVYVPDGQTTTSAHRVAYVLSGGVIPDGLHVDHLCRNPSCVNPDHLEPVTPRENVHRGDSPGIRVQRSGICSAGLHTTDGLCRVCKNERQQRSRARRRAESPPTGPGSYQRNKTHCPQGHPYDAENAYEHGGRRQCRECMRARRRAWGAARRANGGAP
jgi:hypothetical protein